MGVIYCPTDCGKCISPGSKCEFCIHSVRFHDFKDNYKPESKRIPVTISIKDHENPLHLHITKELFNAIKQAHPKGYIEVP